MSAAALASAKRSIEAARSVGAAVNAFSAILEERAMAEAARCPDRAPLAGLTFSVKNLFDVQSLTTLAGSIINRDHAPAVKDAPLVERMVTGGAVLVGTNHMGEYAYDFTGENSHYGPTRNPHDLEHMSGGSSGGSAAAVAAGIVDVALGSDTNGSIRLPAALCGIYGLRPSVGRLTSTGAFPFCETLDQFGPLARTLETLAKAFDVLQAGERHHAVKLSALEALSARPKPLRVGRLRGYCEAACEPDIVEAVERAGRAAQARDVVVDDMAAARAAAFLITNAEGGALHLARLRSRAHDFDPDTRARFMAGALLPAQWYLRAQAFRKRFVATMTALFSEFDVLIAPACPVTAPRIGERTMVLHGREMALRPNLGLITQAISLSGLPILCVPLARHAGLPIGLQIIGPPEGEAICFGAAAALQAQGVVAAPQVRL